MAFKLGDLLVDRIVMGVAENSAGKLLYTLTNLQDATIDITADSTDAVDGTGAVIKTFYRGKTGTLTATNSTLNLPIIGAMSGTDPKEASVDSPLNIPMIITTAKTTAITLPGITDAGTDAGIVVNAINASGTLGTEYALAASGASAAVGTYSVTGGKMTIKPQTGDTKFIIKYNRNVTENGIAIINRSDKFPKSVKLTLKVLVVDPCQTDVVRAAYVVIPNFQPSAEISVGFTTDGTIDFTGNLMTSYCGEQKVLYSIVVAADDKEQEE